jgi:hypothetical protein
VGQGDEGVKSTALDVQHRMRDPDDAPSDHSFAFDDLNKIANPRRRTTQSHRTRPRLLLSLKLHRLNAGPRIPPGGVSRDRRAQTIVRSGNNSAGQPSFPPLRRSVYSLFSGGSTLSAERDPDLQKQEEL